MKKPQEEKDILGRRGAAAAVVFFVAGLIFLLIWMRVGIGPYGLHWSWRVPATATIICTVLGYFMPERMVDFTANLVGNLWGLWP
jgi:hypothetical protein